VLGSFKGVGFHLNGFYNRRLTYDSIINLPSPLVKYVISIYFFISFLHRYNAHHTFMEEFRSPPRLEGDFRCECGEGNLLFQPAC
jgi:hypothetical protein